MFRSFMHAVCRRPAIGVLAIVALAFAPASAQASLTTLTGEFLASHTAATITSGACNPMGNSTYTFEVSGPATGPYAGTFTESGSVTIGPQVDPIPGAPGQFRGPITAYESTFTVTSPAGNIVGTKSLVPGSAANYAGCISSAAQIIASALTYQASIPGGTDGGSSWSNFNAYEAPAPSNPGSFEFRGAFSSNGATGSDTTAPVITVPGTITVPATSPSGAVVTYDVTVADDVDENPSLTCTPPTGSTFPVGTSTVTCTSTDDAGNSSHETFHVVVESPRDSDGDGLYDVIEIWLDCDPHNADTDGDGIGDHIEVLLGTSPTRADTDTADGDGNDGSHLTRVYGHLCGCGPDDDPDGDGVVTWVELRYGTNPGDPDSDGAGGYSSDLDYVYHLCGCKPIDENGDGIPTMVDKFYGGGGGALQIIRRCGCHPWENPSGGGGTWVDFRYVGGPYGEADDPDGDGIDTIIEIWLGCNPNDDDTDGDGLNDRRELDIGTDPTRADTDGDGLDDGREIDIGCNPLDRDTDHDQLPDGTDPAPLVKVTLLVADGRAPVRLGTPVRAVLTCTGQPSAAEIAWGDATASTSTSGVDTAHTYTATGVYTVKGTCTDTTNGSQREEYQYVVVYDPNAGFVTGGGWIRPVSGEPHWRCRSNFGFVAKYKKGQAVPTGETEFEAGGVDFHSTSYEWMLISGSATSGYTSQIKGVGRIKGRTGKFAFKLEVFDAAKTRGADRLRMRITAPDGTEVYDNGADQPIDGGSIVVHT